MWLGLVRIGDGLDCLADEPRLCFARSFVPTRNDSIIARDWELGTGTSAMAIGTVLLCCEVLILVLVKLSQIVCTAAFFGKLLENSCTFTA